MSCSNILLPPYGYYVRLLFGKGTSVERDLMLSQQNKNFRSSGVGRLKYLGWTRDDKPGYSRSSQFSSQGRSWPTGRTSRPPQVWQGSLLLREPEWELLSDMQTLQQESMKPGNTEKDIYLYDHRIMFNESVPVARPVFDPGQAISRPGIYQYWACFRSEITKLTVTDLRRLPSSDELQYSIDIELIERLPGLENLP